MQAIGRKMSDFQLGSVQGKFTFHDSTYQAYHGNGIQAWTHPGEPKVSVGDHAVQMARSRKNLDNQQGVLSTSQEASKMMIETLPGISHSQQASFTTSKHSHEKPTENLSISDLVEIGPDTAKNNSNGLGANAQELSRKIFEEVTRDLPMEQLLKVKERFRGLFGTSSNGKRKREDEVVELEEIEPLKKQLKCDDCGKIKKRGCDMRRVESKTPPEF